MIFKQFQIFLSNNNTHTHTDTHTHIHTHTHKHTHTHPQIQEHSDERSKHQLPLWVSPVAYDQGNPLSNYIKISYLPKTDLWQVGFVNAIQYWYTQGLTDTHPLSERESLTHRHTQTHEHKHRHTHTHPQTNTQTHIHMQEVCRRSSIDVIFFPSKDNPIIRSLSSRGGGSSAVI